jgi:site-specific DNA-methyltransferase (adenine-specific)
VGGTVLDPFAGSGTTAGVAIKHDRRAVLIEANADYVDIIHDRVNEIAGLKNNPLFV